MSAPPAACRLAITVLALVGSACRAPVDDAAAPTFAGATLRIVVAYHAGGPYDLHARLLSSYLGRHLPGHPSVVVENMGGAGGQMGSKYLANIAKPDGLTIGLIAETSAANAVGADLLGRFQLLGSPGAPPQVVVFSGRSSITTVEEWRRASRPQRFGSAGPLSPTQIVPVIAGAALGLPVRALSGYSGSAEMRLALESGEVDAMCLSMDAFNTAYRSSPGVHAVLRFSPEAIPGFDAPDALALAPDAHARELLETGIYSMTPMIRFYAAPRSSAVRVKLLREGLAKAWADPGFLAAATGAGLDIEPVSAEALEQLLRNVAARPAILAELTSLLQLR